MLLSVVKSKSEEKEELKICSEEAAVFPCSNLNEIVIKKCFPDNDLKAGKKIETEKCIVKY